MQPKKHNWHCNQNQSLTLWPPRLWSTGRLCKAGSIVLQKPYRSVQYNRHRNSKSTDADRIALNRLALPLSELDGHPKLRVTQRSFPLKPQRRRRQQEAQFWRMVGAQSCWRRRTHMNWPKADNDRERSAEVIQSTYYAGDCLGMLKYIISQLSIRPGTARVYVNTRPLTGPIYAGMKHEYQYQCETVLFQRTSHFYLKLQLLTKARWEGSFSWMSKYHNIAFGNIRG